MNIFFGVTSTIIFGIFFICYALDIDLTKPLRKFIMKFDFYKFFNLHSGVISNIDENSQIITVDYYVKGKKRQGKIPINAFSYPTINMDFNIYEGMEVDITLNENNNIETVFFKDKKTEEKKVKRKTDWFSLFIGVVFLIVGLYSIVYLIL